MDLGLYYCDMFFRDPYWENYCKLVAGIQVLQRPVITLYKTFDTAIQSSRILSGNSEALYYQRQSISGFTLFEHSIHLLTHLSPLRPPAPVHWPVTHSGQWKQLSGNLGERKITTRQRPLSQPWKERGVLRAQLNSVVSDISQT